MIPYAEFYNYDRLENAAVELGLLNTEADEENLLTCIISWYGICTGSIRTHVRMPFFIQ